MVANNQHTYPYIGLQRSPRARLLLSAAFALAPIAAAAQEQDAAEDETPDAGVERIVVTGSRIQRSDLQASSPVNFVDDLELTLTGTVNVERVVRDLPQFVPSASTSVVNNGNLGGASINLRNLGPVRTLVLMDGSRVVPLTAAGTVDVNIIPAALVERIDIVTGGASAVYGSDAIAGVVNFILKDDFEGLEFDGQYFITQEGDGETGDLNFTAGANFDDGRGNVVFHGAYTSRNEITQDSRSFSEFALGAGALNELGSNTDVTGAVIATIFRPEFDVNGDGVLDTNDDPNLQPGFFDFNPDGTLDPQTETFNFNPFNFIQVPQERWTGLALGRYEINDLVEFYGRTHFANNRVDTVLAPSGTFFFPFNINLDNPFLAPQAVDLLADPDGDGILSGGVDADGDGVIDPGAQVTLPFGRRLPEVGSRDTFNENFVIQLKAGFRGEFWDTWNWDVSYQFSRSQQSTVNQNDINFANAQQAILAVRNPDGTIGCLDPSGGCAPANFFGQGNLSPEAAEFIALDLNQEINRDQTVITGILAGDLERFDLKSPFAEAAPGFAVGFEYREEDGQVLADDNLQSGNSIGFGSTSNVEARFDVAEAFFEARIPLIQDVFLIDDLSIEGGYRYSDYSSVGGVTTFKGGGEWTVMDGLRFRGLFQRAVRAPNLAEIGAPRTPGVGNASSDPCAGQNPVGNQTLIDLCVATGAPLEAIGTINGPIAGQVNIFTGGNSALEEERSNTFTAGAVFQPDFLPDLTFTADYYRITINGVIAAFGGSVDNIIAGCFSITQDPNSEFCQRIIRNPVSGGLIGGTETGVDTSLGNGAFLQTAGVDFAVDYGFSMDDVGLEGWGDWDFRWNAVWNRKSDFQGNALAPVDECGGTFGNICGEPDPTYRHALRATWSKDAFLVSAQWRYIGGVTFDNVALERGGPIANSEIPAYSYVDLSGVWTITDNYSVRVGVDNLFDTDPPIVGTGAGPTSNNNANTFPSTYDALGRAFFFGATARF